MNAAELAAELQAAHPEANAASGPGSLPEGVLAGHRHAYRCGSRAGVAYAQPDGSWTMKPGGVVADWITRNAAHATFVHAPYECAGCGR